MNRISSISILITIIAITTRGWGWNVTEVGSYDPPGLAHYLDIQYGGSDTTYICGSGGFSILSVNTLQSPYRIGHFSRPAQEPLPNLTVRGNFALLCAQETGLHIVSTSTPTQPQLRNTMSVGIGSAEDAIFINDTLAAVCLNNLGIRLLSIAQPTQPQWISPLFTTLGFSKSIATRANDSLLFVATNYGLEILSIRNQNLYSISSIPLAGGAQDIQIQNNLVFVARGSNGIFILDISNPYQPVLINQIVNANFSAKLSVSSNHLAVANWDDFQIYSISDSTAPILSGYRWTPGRAMTVAMKGDTIFCGDWEIFRTYRFGIITGPDLEAIPRSMRFPVTPIGQSVSRTFTLKNYGGQTVNITRIVSTNNHYSFQPSTISLVPNDSIQVNVVYAPTSNTSGTTVFRIQSNDPDEPNLLIQVSGNPPAGGVSVGNPAPNFTLPILSGGNFTLNQSMGSIVAMFYFATW